MTVNVLKPCPFCADTAVSVVFANLSARACCQQCGALGPERQQKQTMEQAIGVWNQRDHVRLKH